MASPDRFADAPEIGWGFYGHRLELYRETVPHGGFGQLLRFAQSRSRGFFVFTSNVDGHFQSAGFPEDRMVECHGNITHLQCFENCGDRIWEVGDSRVVVDTKTMRAVEPLPCCPSCGGLARPNILMFGDWGWNGARTECQEQRFRRWMESIETGTEKGLRTVVLEFGAGTAVPTVRRFSEWFCARTRGHLIRVNPREAEIPDQLAGVELALGAREAIERLLI